MISDHDFHLKLREDMMQTKQRRFRYQLAKVTALSSLAGVGVALIKDVDLVAFFYVIPFVSFVFELMIYGESFSLRRMAEFVLECKDNEKDAECKWEIFVQDNQDRFAAIGSYLSTTIATFGSLIILVLKSKKGFLWFTNRFNIIWSFIVIAILCLFWVIQWTRIGKRKWDKRVFGK